MLVFLSCLHAFPDGSISGSGAISGAGLITASAVVPIKATTPTPPDDATRVLSGPTLSWVNGGGALTYKVYLDNETPPVTEVQDSAATSYNATGLDYSTEYFWRVDSINGAGTTTGDVWSFTTATPLVVDAYINADGGESGNTITEEILDDGTIGVIGTWTVSATAATGETVVGGGELPLYTPVTVGATTYEDLSGARNLRSAQQLDENYVLLDFTDPHDSVSVGGFVTFNANPGVSGGLLDNMFIGGESGEFCVCQENLQTTRVIRAHSQGSGVSLFGTDIAIVVGRTYWITLQYDRNALCSMRVYYDASGGNWASAASAVPTEVGSGSTVALKDQPATFFSFGRTDAHGTITSVGSATTDFEDLVIDFTNAVFPLGP